MRRIATPGFKARFEWGDISAAWFESGNEASVQMVIDVAALDGDPPGEVGLHFRVGSQWWIAGWTTIVIPGAPPDAYAGGFYCAAAADGSVPDPQACQGLEAMHDSDRFNVTVPLVTFGIKVASPIEEPRGYAVDVASAQPGLGLVFVERTAVGRDYSMPVAETQASPQVEAESDRAGDESSTQSGSLDAQEPRGSRGAPGFAGAPLALLLVAFAMPRP